MDPRSGGRDGLLVILNHGILVLQTETQILYFLIHSSSRYVDETPSRGLARCREVPSWWRGRPLPGVQLT